MQQLLNVSAWDDSIYWAVIVCLHYTFHLMWALKEYSWGWWCYPHLWVDHVTQEVSSRVSDHLAQYCWPFRASAGKIWFLKVVFIFEEIIMCIQPKVIFFLVLAYFVYNLLKIPGYQFSSVAQLCLTLCNPMDCSTPGFLVHHQLLELAQTHVCWGGDAIQPSHPLLSPSSPAFSLSQHQGLFQWVSSSHQVAKVLELQLQHQSFQWTPRTGFL